MSNKTTIKAKDIKVGDQVKRPGESVYRTVTEVETRKTHILVFFKAEGSYVSINTCFVEGRGIRDRRHPNYSYVAKAEVAS